MGLFFVFMFVFSGLKLFFGQISRFNQARIFTEEQKKIIQIISISMFLVCFLIFSVQIFWFLATLFVYFLILITFSAQLRKNREKNFKIAVCNYLDRVILYLRSGKSLRVSYTEANRLSDAFSQQKIAQMLDIVFQTNHFKALSSKSFADEITRELIEIDKSSHKAIQRIMSVRRTLAIEIEFRKKVGQVMLKSRMQCYFIAALYFALVLCMWFFYGFKTISPYFLVSVPIFGVGFVWLTFIGRKIRWKV